ncbi:MAG: hypothetical protein II299_03940 [Alistipes sp.]|nr:hypothetical protein [Alistipes sp.]
MRWLVAIALLLLSSCGGSERLSISEVEVLSVKGDEYPTSAVLRLDVKNSAGAFTLKQCRLRFGIEGRKQVVVTLTEKIKLRRGEQRVTLPIKISIVRNSLTMKLREALAQHDASQIEVDGEWWIRKGLLSKRGVIDSTPIERLLTDEELTRVWSVMDENKK